MKKPKLVICDIDSTLVVKHENLTSRAIAAIKELRKNGVYFGVASGRPLYQIEGCARKWGYTDFDIVIAHNGSQLWDGVDKKEHSYYGMKKEWIKETIELMSPFETNPSIYRDNIQWFLEEDEHMRLYSEKFDFRVELVENMEFFYEEDTEKIMFRVEPEIMPEVEKWVNEHPSENYVGFKTCPDLMEFCNKKANKGYAMKKFCELHDVALEDIMAFGDTSNDNEMLIAAGVGVCMLNGSDDTKAIADIITEKECDEDGWADYMENHVLPLL